MSTRACHHCGKEVPVSEWFLGPVEILGRANGDDPDRTQGCGESTGQMVEVRLANRSRVVAANCVRVGRMTTAEQRKDLKTIIAGSRSIDSFAVVSHAVDACGWRISEVVSTAGARFIRPTEEVGKR
jgi:hypothetical protein